GVGAAVAHRLEGKGEISLHEQSLGEGVRMVERPQVALDLGDGGGAEEIGLAGRGDALPVGGREALARVRDGIGEQTLPGERGAHATGAVLMRLPPAVDRPGHGGGAGTAPGPPRGGMASRIPRPAYHSTEAARADRPAPHSAVRPEEVAS